MRVVITVAARGDLASIQDYIAEDNPVRAESFAKDLVDRCEDLADSPRRYPLLPRHEAEGIRRRAYRSYLILYRIAGDTIEVLHVVHGARDYERLLSGDEEGSP